MEKQQIEALLLSEAQQHQFSGWDFSVLKGRYTQEKLSWDYRAIVRKYLQKQLHWLDLGTGGGELLATFGHPPERTAVTEGWPKNYQLLLTTLRPKGVQVVFEESMHHLDFPSNHFDLVTSSHAAFSVAEVKRVLKPGGYFITQQVGDRNGNQLAARLHCTKPRFELNVASVTAELSQAGFTILQQAEAYPKQFFYDLGALVYYVRTISWEYPDFAVKDKLPELEQLAEEWQAKGVIENQQHRFLVVSQKV